MNDINEHTAQMLAACSCAAVMDTPTSHAIAHIKRTSPFWSPAYEDVMRRTAECIRLREELAALQCSIPLSSHIAAEALRLEQAKYAAKAEVETNPVQQRYYEALATGLGRAVIIILELAK